MLKSYENKYFMVLKCIQIKLINLLKFINLLAQLRQLNLFK
jgi:hypothetical protein